MAWLTTQEAAELEGVSERTIRRNIERYVYEHANGAGGKNGVQYRISLESLSRKAQDKYNNIQEEKEYSKMESFTGKQREEAEFKAYIVKRYQDFHLSAEEFLHQFNQDNPGENITKHQLFRWQKKLKEGGVAALIDQRGGHNKGTTIQKEPWDYFYALYMKQQKPSIQRCWEFTKDEYPDIPSVSAFEREVRNLPHLVKVFYREGENAFNDARPSMDRDRHDINSNDIWFSDHHLMDIAVKNKTGKVVRPWLTIFFDARSNRVISIILRDKSADATVIKQCLRIGMEQNGVPNEVYFDNGKDYREKSFSKDFPYSIVNQVGIGSIYATPYHGQAKTVERFFRTLEDRFCKFFPTYLGKDAKQRPEQVRVLLEKLAGIAPDIDDFMKKLNDFIQEYNNTPSKGKNMDKRCPDQVYYENLKVKKEIHDKDALRILCGTFEERKVGKNGIQFQNRKYYVSTLLNHQGEKVMINYDPYNLDELKVFDMEMRAICIAPAKVVTPFRKTTQEDYREAKKEHKKARQLIEQYKPVRELDVMQIIARKQLLEKQYQESEDMTVIDCITPQMTNNSRIFKETTNPTRIKEEDSISATLLKRFEREKIGG